MLAAAALAPSHPPPYRACMHSLCLPLLLGFLLLSFLGLVYAAIRSWEG